MDNLAGELVYTADKYDLEELRMICEDKLITMILVDNCIDLSRLSDAHSLEKTWKLSDTIHHRKLWRDWKICV